MFDVVSGYLYLLVYVQGLVCVVVCVGVVIYEYLLVLWLEWGMCLWLCIVVGSVSVSYVVIVGNVLLQGIVLVQEVWIMLVGIYIGVLQVLGKVCVQVLICNDMVVVDVSWVLDYFCFSYDYWLLFGGWVSYLVLLLLGLCGVMMWCMYQVFLQLVDVGMDYVWGGLVDIICNCVFDWGCLDFMVYYVQGFFGYGVVVVGLVGVILVEVIVGQLEWLDVFVCIFYCCFLGGCVLCILLLVVVMFWYKLCDVLW